MKPIILHVVSGHSMNWTGGINATLRSLAQSRLGDRFDFQVLPLQAALPQLSTLQPAAIAVHAPCSWRGLKALWSLKQQAPLLLNEHHYSANFEAFNVPSPRRFRWMLRFSYGLADRVIAISVAQRDWMQKHRLVTDAKMTLIQSSRTVEPFLAVPPKRRDPDQPFILGAYGRFCPQKGFDTLIEAMQRLANPHIQLHLGGGGPEEEMLKSLAQSCPQIQFVGRIDDVPTFLSQCDAVVIPSRWEPWGNVCLEARAAAKPIIATAVDGLSEQIQGCGHLIPPDNPVALATAIQALAQESPDQVQGLGQQGRLSAQSAWDTYLTQWQSLLEGVL